MSSPTENTADSTSLLEENLLLPDSPVKNEAMLLKFGFGREIGPKMELVSHLHLYFLLLHQLLHNMVLILAIVMQKTHSGLLVLFLLVLV